MSEIENPTPKQKVRLAFFRSEGLIGSLVALLSILTALIGLRSSEFGSMADDFDLKAQRTMSEANREYLDVGQVVVQDFISFDSWFAAANNEAEENYIASFSDMLYENISDPDRTAFDDKYVQDLLVTDTGILDKSQQFMLDIINFNNYYASTNFSAADNFRGSFSSTLNENVDDPGRDLFDEAYYDDMYSFSYGCFAEADTLFEQGQQAGDVADQYQYAMFIFAVALAMAAWASLLGETGTMRLLFVFFSLALMLFGTVIYFGISAEASNVLQAAVETGCLEALTGG